MASKKAEVEWWIQAWMPKATHVENDGVEHERPWGAPSVCGPHGTKSACTGPSGQCARDMQLLASGLHAMFKVSIPSLLKCMPNKR